MSEPAPPVDERRLRVCRVKVSGRVQGVYFRAHTARSAMALGVRGYARNLEDGRVEVLAGGPPAAIAALLEVVRQGPPLAVVEGFVVTELDAAALAGITDFTCG